ncbi:MAG: hypothetical protein HZB98_15415, partial [Bacteroidia bacterium]|nr:hypothetical protein [Bacteroidia bacterium]
MAKSIKKVLKYFIIVSGALALLLLTLFLVLQIPDVQTYIIHKISVRISREFKSTIQVGSIEYKFFNRLIINDLLIKDQNNDTLIYAEKTIAGIRKFDLKNNSVKLGKIYLIKPVVALITDTAGTLNLKWYLEKLRSSPDSKKRKNSRISVDLIDLHDARFALIDRRGKPGKSKINFNNLNINAINGTIELLNIENDTTSFDIHNIRFTESSGFNVNKFTSSLSISHGSLNFNSTFITTDSSIINLDELSLKGDSAGSFSNFVEKVNLRAVFEKSLISSSDLSHFIPLMGELNESVWLSGRVSGTISELRGRNILMSYRDYSQLDCDFDFSGLPDINNSFIYLGVNKFTTNALDLEKIILPGKKKLELPALLYKFENITFDGSFTGFITDFVTYGHFRSKNGTITTDLSLRPEGKKSYRIKGLLKGTEINLGEITGKKDLLGNISINANIDGYATSMKKFNANLTGKIDSISIKKYVYRDIALNGIFTEKTWDGSINISDRNIKMEVLGLFNFENKLPEFDFTLNIANAKLHNLNLDRKDTSSRVTLLLTSNFRGNSIDNLDGEIRLLNSSLVRYGNILELYDFSVKTYLSGNKPVLSIRTDFVDADITGPHNFSEFGDLTKYLLAKLMPSKFVSVSKQKEIKRNNFSFNIKFKNTDEINYFFNTGFLISENSFLEGDIYPDSIFRIHGSSQTLSIHNNIFSDFALSTRIRGNELSLGINARSLEVLRQARLDSFRIDLST